MNLVILKGRITADPTIRTANSGTTIAGFSIAVDRRLKDKVTGERKTDFIRCTAFGKTAEMLQRFFFKGKEILVEGELQQNDYTDKDGHDVKTYQVIVNQVHFCGSKSDTEQSGAEHYDPVQHEPAQSSQAKSDGLPDTSQFEQVLADGEVPF